MSSPRIALTELTPEVIEYVLRPMSQIETHFIQNIFSSGGWCYMTANNRRPVETPAEWFRFADENRQVAERELAYQELAAHTICFLSQSAAEKYLKGYLIAHGWTLEKTHDIVELLELCAEHDQAFSALLAEGEILNEYVTG